MNPAEFQANTPYAGFGTTVIDAPIDARRTFVRKTYTHLAAAIYAFVGLEWLFFSLGFHEPFMRMLAGQPLYWLLVLGAFVAVNWVADSWARSATSIGTQYAGLFLTVAAWAVIFIPILAIAQPYTVDVQGNPIGVISAAAVTTLVMFAGLTAFAFLTKKDFSFLGGFLSLAMFGAIALIVVSIFFGGFNLGVWFSAAMIIVACGYILYDTSNVIHHYRTDQYVAASVALFASVALLFWYVLRILIALSGRD